MFCFLFSTSCLFYWKRSLKKTCSIQLRSKRWWIKSTVCFDFVIPLCFCSTRPRWHPGWGSGKLTCRTGAGRTCHPLPTPVCSGCLASQVTLVSVATWQSQRPVDWKHKPASTQWTAACVNGLVGSLYYMIENQRQTCCNNIFRCKYNETMYMFEKEIGKKKLPLCVVIGKYWLTNNVWWKNALTLNATSVKEDWQLY